ncbi:hypothetical protein H310_05932 [Aphanomyces invadans]|uniref:COMM domain-containing protein n=1 Tax=Aphanomyces invadans TaxID=157072 RepID=A0A024UA14_9STRA|nr:hypothetical protein H310_05932 [Aphanomyces invadans]ETW02418.1 hypothetical protein H310_05932 [Aphanomyces invadans]|eukprot:XP_008869023.1 hypothetical protein H310_05932 [Aphanomyces invadans]
MNNVATAPSTASYESKKSSLKWRVDVVLHTNQHANVHEPKALVELNPREVSGEAFRLQLSRTQVTQVLNEFEKIQQLMEARQTPHAAAQGGGMGLA